MAKFRFTPTERHLLVALHTFVVSLVPQLIAVHGHIDRDLLLSVIPALAVTALVAGFPGVKKDVKEAAQVAVEVAKVAPDVTPNKTVAAVAADVATVAKAAESAQ